MPERSTVYTFSFSLSAGAGLYAAAKTSKINYAYNITGLIFYCDQAPPTDARVRIYVAPDIDVTTPSAVQGTNLIAPNSSVDYFLPTNIPLDIDMQYPVDYRGSVIAVQLQNAAAATRSVTAYLIVESDE